MFNTEKKASKLSTDKKLCDLVFESLINLPAYKLKGRSQQALRQYFFAGFDRSVKSKTFEQSVLESENEDTRDKTFFELYQKPNYLKVICTSLKIFLKRYKFLVLLIVASYLSAFFVGANPTFSKVAGLISFLIFFFSILFGIAQFINYNFDVDSTFSLVNRTYSSILDYIDSFQDINENSLSRKANIIAENIIKDEISGLAYDLIKLDLFSLFFAFIISVFFMLICGENFIEETEWIKKVLNFGDFKVVKDLTTETFVFIVLIPVMIPVYKYIRVSALNHRDKRLRQSLTVIENFIKTDVMDTVSTASLEDARQPNQSAITELFGTIEYEDDYDYKEQRRNS